MVDKASQVQVGGVTGDAYEEYDGEVAGGQTVTPGMLLEVTGRNSDGSLVVQPHSTDGGAPEILYWADIDPWSGDPSDGVDPVEDAVPAGEYVSVFATRKMAGVNAVLASGTDLVTAADADISDLEDLTSAGDGTLRSTANGGGTALARATEAVNNSGAAAGETERLLCESY